MPAALGFLGGVFSFGAGTAFAAGGAAFGGWVAGAGFASTILGSITVKLLTTVAFTALSQALASEPPQGGGLTIPATLRGEDNPETIILGRYATGGQAICPPYSHGKDGRYLTQIIELCSAPGATLERFMLGDEWRELTDDWTPRADQNKEHFGKLVVGQEENLTWVKYYDGTQTVADPYLREKYGNHPDRPWTADMVGHGICYAILTFRHDREHQSAVPRYRFEMGGIPLYDIRRDSTAGGVGPQRLADPSTWTPSHNPIVQGWNLMRGIPLPGGEVYGGDMQDLRALPQASWVSAMNRADVAVEIDDGTEPAYRAGLEIALDQPPAAALEELFKAASATVADQGHGWTVTVGAPDLPVYAFSDDDIIVSQPQELDPFPGLEQTYNAVTGRYPEPEELWETKEAPQRTNAEWEASDAFGRRSATLSLPSVPYGNQVQRLMRAWIEEERRFRRHVINLPPDAAHLELTDVIDWTSGRNGYAGKDFGVFEIAEDPRTGIRKLSIRERDASDYDWQPGFTLPSPPSPTITTPPAPVAIDGWAVAAITLQDIEGRDRRPAIRLVWDPETIGDSLIWELRLTGQTDVILDGEVRTLSRGRTVISAGILPATGYEARGRVISARRPTIWTGWTAVVTENVGISPEDIPASVLEDLADFRDDIDRIDGELDGISDEINNVVGAAIGTLTDDFDALELQLQQGLNGVSGQIQTGIDAYDVIVQGREAALAGQIEQLTAALTSDNLIDNPSFADGLTGWTVVSGTANVVAREGSGDALILAAPDTHVLNLGVGNAATIERAINTFEADPAEDKLQIRIWAASGAATRTQQIRVQFKDSGGADLGAAITTSLTVTPANTWKSYSAQFDIPANATQGTLTLLKTQTGTRVAITKITVEIVNVAIVARVTTLEGARVTADAAFAAFQSTVTATFGDMSGAISTEASTRAAADGVLSGRMTAVESQTGLNTADITEFATTITTTNQAIAALDERLTVQYGSTQLVRDPGFASGLTYWTGSLGSINNLIARSTASGALAVQRAMPERRAFWVGAGDSDSLSRQSGWMDISPDEGLTLSASIFRQTNGPTGRVAVQFRADNGDITGVSGSVIGGAPGTWLNAVRDDIVPPANSAQARIVFWRGAEGTAGTLDRVYMTGFRLSRQVGYEALSKAEVVNLKAARATADLAFSQYVTGANSRFQDLETDTTNLASSLTTYQTKADASSTIAALRNEVNAQYGRTSASGRLRVYSVAAPTGAVTRIALAAEASGETTDSIAGMFMYADAEGRSWITFQADRFAIVNGPGPGATQTVPFYVQGGVTYIDMAVVRDLSVDTFKIANRAITQQWSGRFTHIATIPSPTWARQLNFPSSSGSNLIFGFTAVSAKGSGLEATMRFTVYLNEVEILTTPALNIPDVTAVVLVGVAVSGGNNLRVEGRHLNPLANSPAITTDLHLFAFEAKK